MNRIDGVVDLFGVPFSAYPTAARRDAGDWIPLGKAAYLTDMNYIPNDSMQMLQNLDVVILDAYVTRLIPAIPRFRSR